MDIWTSGLCALFGAGVQELAHWYELRGKLSSTTYASMMVSPAYWVITAAMIVASAVGPVLWKAGELSNYSLFDFVLFGAAFPALFKKAVTGVSANGAVKLGESRPSVVKTYFLLGEKA